MGLSGSLTMALTDAVLGASRTSSVRFSMAPMMSSGCLQVLPAYWEISLADFMYRSACRAYPVSK
eukprot:2527094-Ditylum_brightwellii.AAC.1